MVARASARYRASRLGALVELFGSIRPGYLGAALAYQMMLSLFPLAFLALSLVQLLMGAQAGQRAIGQALGPVVPADSRQPLLAVLDTLRSRAGLFGAASTLGLLWTGSFLFGNLEEAMDRIYGVKVRGFLRQKAMSMAMVVVFLVLVLVASALSTLPTYLASGTAQAMHLLAHGPARVLVHASLGFVATLVLFALVFSVVPNLRLGLGQVWTGALVSTLLLQGAGLGFGVYLRLVKASRYGVFGLLLVLLLWFYYLAEILLLGVALNGLIFHALRRRERAAPPP